MNKFLIALVVILPLSGTGAHAADNGDLPEIAAYDDAAYDPLPDVISAQFDGLTTEVSVANAVMTEAPSAADNGGLPEIAAVDDESYEALPGVVAAQ